MESIEEKIAAVAAKQKADNWANRQEAARQQQADSERQRVERYRSQRIAQIKAALDGKDRKAIAEAAANPELEVIEIEVPGNV